MKHLLFKFRLLLLLMMMMLCIFTYIYLLIVYETYRCILLVMLMCKPFYSFTGTLVFMEIKYFKVNKVDHKTIFQNYFNVMHNTLFDQ